MFNKLFLIIVIITSIFTVSCKNSTSSKNTDPIAAFTIDATVGSTAKTFNFNASGSVDNEDEASDLNVRWDWENDGTYDTDYSTTKTATHQYSIEGTFTVNLEVKDKGGLTNTIKKYVTVCNSCVMTDIDGNEYEIITIGDQLWMAKNLKVTHYRNGDVIPNVTNDTEWSNLSTGAYCSYGNYDSNVNPYGLLYNWLTVNDNRKLAPAGWHIPTDDEWKQLEVYLGMDDVEVDNTGYQRTSVGYKLKSTNGWRDNLNGTNSSGFTALPGGCHRNFGPFTEIGDSAYFWSSTESTATYAWCRKLNYNNETIGYIGANKRNGFSVRCVKD